MGNGRAGRLLAINHRPTGVKPDGGVDDHHHNAPAPAEFTSAERMIGR